MTFSYFFRISGLEGFLSSIPGTRNRKHRVEDSAEVLLNGFDATEKMKQPQNRPGQDAVVAAHHHMKVQLYC